MGAVIPTILSAVGIGKGAEKFEEQRQAGRQQKIALEDLQREQQRELTGESEKLRKQVSSRQRGFLSLIRTSPLGVAGPGSFFQRRAGGAA